MSVGTVSVGGALVRAAVLGSFGLLFGSFLTVVIARVPERRSVVAPRSCCPACGAPIRPRDNIPVVSYALLRGRCRGCHEPISLLYPAIEAGTTVLFVAVGLAFSDPWRDTLLAPFLGILLAAAVIDIRHRIIPNRLVYAAVVMFGLFLLVAQLAHAGPHLLGAAVGFLLYGGSLFVVAVAVPGGMGMGDVKLAALIGMVLGSLGLSYVAVAGMASVLAGGLGAVMALLAGRSRRQTIPFGPYLAAGATVASLFGARLAAWYGGLLH